MSQKVLRAVLASIALIVALVSTSVGVRGQSGAKNGEWPTYGGDLGHTRYAPLDQIAAGNFSKLEIAWRFKTDNLGPRREFNLESTPLMVNGKLYSTAGSRRAVVALDAATGELLWMHSEHEGARGAAAQPFPTKPPAYDRQGLSIDDLIDFTPEVRAEAMSRRRADRARTAVDQAAV